MERLVIRELISLLVAFIVFPFLFALMLGAASPGELLMGGALLFFVQFFTIVPLWPIPFVLGSVAALLWHGIAEMLRKEYDEPPPD